jgi:FkbM family methyltransferase
MIGKLFSDFRGIVRVCGLGPALRWAMGVVVTLPTVIRTRNLMSADRRMGHGPFKVHHAVGDAVLVGRHVFSGIREIWVREVYAKDGFLQIPDHGVVIDLGANMGNFSAMALASNATARLIAVEPSARIGKKWGATMQANGFTDRAQLCRAFVGDFTPVQLNDIKTDPAYADAPHLTEAEFLAQYAIDHIDFLKCDIEGSEYFMIQPGSRILDITDRLAIEVHDGGGDVKRFLAVLAERGFSDIKVDWYGSECIARAARPTAQALAA